MLIGKTIFIFCFEVDRKMPIDLESFYRKNVLLKKFSTERNVIKFD